jgi:malate dehydrogenase (oxaloacetate-decarboxylating)(NADP+)
LTKNQTYSIQLGFGAVLAKVTSIPESLIQASAIALSKSLNESERAQGLIYPELKRIREISIVITREVIRVAQRENVDRARELRFLNDKQLEDYIRERMYDPTTDGLEELAKL